MPAATAPTRHTAPNGRTVEWRLHGHLHREDGPAVTDPNGYSEWHLHGQLHRDHGPAIQHSDGTLRWYTHGQLHRDGGPAVEYPNGARAWRFNGQRHRTDGPSFETVAGRHYWFLNDEPATAATVVTAWLQDHHPDTDQATRALLIQLAQEWTLGDTMTDLYAAALAATT